MSEIVHVDAQVHGYKQGHQLLSASLNLPKTDQALVDQLSDLAGPLRPGEDFSPYVSAYPLPSGSHYVLAKTWQDKTVARAGCVRTLSLLIPSLSWAEAEGLADFFDLLETETLPSVAQASAINPPKSRSLPPVPEFDGRELLEALFLEDAQPVAVLDAVHPQLIALRLLTALWPSMRRRFSLSTFALSPRRIEGRYFSLVFAPLDARPRFSDWPGRRVDGRASQSSRHRWTGTILKRVFVDPIPRLLDDGGAVPLREEEDAESAAALRISLLWDELIEKLASKPTAVLGLLDIAASKLRDERAIDELRRLVPQATERAVQELAPAAAWDFIGAISKKLNRPSLHEMTRAVANSAARLAVEDPRGALDLICANSTEIRGSPLASEVARAIGQNLNERIEAAVGAVSANCLAHLLLASAEFADAALKSPSLVARLGAIVPELPATEFLAIVPAVVPRLENDSQLAVAAPVFERLDVRSLIQAAVDLSQKRPFRADTFIPLVGNRVMEVGESIEFRNMLLRTAESPARNAFLEATLSCTPADARWLISDKRLTRAFSRAALVRLLSRANDEERSRVFEDVELGSAIVESLPSDALDILTWVLLRIQLPATQHLALALQILPTLNEQDLSSRIASVTVGIALSNHLDDTETSAVVMLLDLVTSDDAFGDLLRIGLARSLTPALLNRNLQVFAKVASPRRVVLLRTIDTVAHALAERFTLDLDEPAADALAHLIWEAEAVDARAHLKACATLLPSLLRALHFPVSLVIAAAFPPVYKELGRQDQVPDFLNFIPFFDWNRCKAARANLVNAFVASRTWAPWHLALTACLSSDVGRILGRIPKTYGWQSFLQLLSEGLGNLPPECFEKTSRAITSINLEGGR